MALEAEDDRAGSRLGRQARVPQVTGLDGADGRPVAGIKPVGKMADVWKRWQARRGEKVPVELPEGDADPFLKLADLTFEEWYSAEDEEAYGELRPL